MAFDECIENPSTREYTARSIARTGPLAGALQEGDAASEFAAGDHQQEPAALRHQSGIDLEDLRIEHMKQIAALTAEFSQERIAQIEICAGNELLLTLPVYAEEDISAETGAVIIDTIQDVMMPYGFLACICAAPSS